MIMTSLKMHSHTHTPTHAGTHAYTHTRTNHKYMKPGHSFPCSLSLSETHTNTLNKHTAIHTHTHCAASCQRSHFGIHHSCQSCMTRLSIRHLYQKLASAMYIMYMHIRINLTNLHIHLITYSASPTQRLPTHTDSTACLCIVDVCRMRRELLHWLLCQIPSEGGTEAPQNDPHSGEHCHMYIKSIFSLRLVSASLSFFVFQ